MDRRNDLTVINRGASSPQCGTLAQVQRITRLLQSLFGGCWILGRIDKVGKVDSQQHGYQSWHTVLSMLPGPKLYVHVPHTSVLLEITPDV